MMMNKTVYALMLVSLGLLSCQKAKRDLQLSQDFIEQQLNHAIEQYQTLGSKVPEDQLPKTYLADKDSLVCSNSGSWTSGFYPGTLLYLYEYANDEKLLDAAKQKLTILEKEKFNKGTHDLGFMLYCSFGNAFRLTGDANYKEVMLTGAESLISRFNPTVGCIRSWDHNGDKWQFPVIIDNMMNLEFLNWASRESGEENYAAISKTHSNTTLKNHFRSDYSSYHVIDYDPETGEVRNKHTHQGAADESAWARGQAWGLYGYTMMYRDTKDSVYLSQANHIADFMINHPNLPDDKIPYWDFDASDIPSAYRDASAAAIMASALLELSTFVDGEKAKQYLTTAEHILQSLSSERYLASIGSNGGFLLMHSTGHLPGDSEIDVPLTYADYYYIEALMRYKDWYL